MSSTSISAEKLKELLQCSLCLETFRAPKALVCLHTFCDNCIHDNLKVTEQDGSTGYTCPHCRKFSPQEETKPNFHTSQLLDLYRESAQTKMCVFCDDTEARWKCLECVETFCEPCKVKHTKLRALRDHNLISLENVDNNLVLDQPMFCDKHTDEILKYNCIKCEQMLCSICPLQDHKGHEYETIDDALKRYLLKLDSNLSQVKLHSNIFTAKANNLDGKISQINEKYEAALEKAKAERIAVLAKVNARFDKVEKELEKIKERETANVVMETELCKNKKAEVDVILSGTENTIATAKGALLLHEIRTQLNDKLENAIKTDENITDFVDINYPVFESCKDLETEILKLAKSKSLPLYNSTRYVIRDFPSTFKTYPRLVKTIDIDHGTYTRGYRTCYGFNKLATCFRVIDTILIHSTDGALITKIQLEDEYKNPRAALFLSESKLAVASESGLYVVDVPSRSVEYRISNGTFSDVCMENNSFYALTPINGEIRKYIKPFDTWIHSSTITIKNNLSLFSTFALGPNMICVINYDDKIFVYDKQTNMRSCVDYDTYTMILSTINSQGELLLLPRAVSCEMLLLPKEVSCSRNEKAAEDSQELQITKLKHSIDLVFQNETTVWVLCTVSADKGQYKLLCLQID